MDETIIAKVVAITLRMVSAYLTTTAITNPPKDRKNIENHVHTYVNVKSTVYPKKNPF